MFSNEWFQREVIRQQTLLNNLWKWASDNGSDLTNIFPLVLYEDNEIKRKVILKKSLQPFELIASIPENILLSEAASRNSPIGKKLQNYLNDNDDENSKSTVNFYFNNIRAEGLLFMITYMVYERFENSNSFWKYYLESLPETFPSLPYYWSPEEIDRYIGSETNLAKQIKTRLKILKDGLNIVQLACGKEFINNTLTWNNFLWAYSAISSRAFPLLKGRIDSNDDKVFNESIKPENNAKNPECCMWPVLDMCDHKLDYKIEWSSVARPGYVSYIAREDTKLNTELYTNYGAKGNEMFLGSYGFVLKDNPNDYVKVNLQISTKDALLEKKKNLLEKYNIRLTSLLFESESVEIGDTELFRAMRILCLNRWEVYLAEKNEHALDYGKSTINIRNEFSAASNLYYLLVKQFKLIIEAVGENHNYGDAFDKNKFYLGNIYCKGQLKILKHIIGKIVFYMKNFIKKKEIPMEKIFLSLSKVFEPINFQGTVLCNSNLSFNTNWLSFLSDFIKNNFTDVDEPIDEDTLLILVIIFKKNFDFKDFVKDINLKEVMDSDLESDVSDHFEFDVKPVLQMSKEFLNASTNMDLKSNVNDLVNITKQDFFIGSCILDTNEINLNFSFHKTLINSHIDYLEDDKFLEDWKTNVYGVMLS
ncbi:hypothetical protein HDU92_006408 [Lobulomyces angularis]|nr:hypothetical protein HDU92_006408 [Lobulomyces angularis]